ncbi:MAG: GNAT family N-acetyltransferase [Acidobacteriota bacterium]
MAIDFRSARLTDIEWLLAAMREFYAIDGYPFDEAITRRNLEKFIADETLGKLWLIENDAKPIGYLVLTFSFSFEFRGRDAFLDELFIDAHFRGQGIGKTAMRFLEERCREYGVQALHLEVERENIAAQKLYKQFGFQDHDRYLMTKRLVE